MVKHTIMTDMFDKMPQNHYGGNGYGNNQYGDRGNSRFRDRKFEQKNQWQRNNPLTFDENGNYVGESRKQMKNVYIEIIADDLAGLCFHKCFIKETEKLLDSMDGVIYDEEKNLYTFPLDKMLDIYEQIEPYCNRKRLNLVGVPEFVFKIINAKVFQRKERKKAKVKMNKKKLKKGEIDHEAEAEKEREKQEKSIFDLPDDFRNKLFPF